MPIVTPSRIAIALLLCSLASFFWTYGFPHQLAAQPAAPVIDHYDYKNVHTKPIIPPPSLPAETHATKPKPTHLGDRPATDDTSRWSDHATSAAAAAASGVATQTHVPEYEQDGGRWEDQSSLDTTNTQLPKFCEEVRGAPHLMVILRTSKAEVKEKLPIHLQGLLSCVPNFAIFSDHSGEINGLPIHNALDTISSDTKRAHDEFREYQIMHADPEHVPDVEKTKKLDKWKILPMVYKAYHLRPQARFFFFIEMDTSLSWTNALQWINRLDYRIPYYTGSPTNIDGTQLAQRGSGIMLSQGALRRYAKSYDEIYASKWEEKVGSKCCGDLVLSQALSDAHVEFYSSWPLVQSEPPHSLDWSRKHWCVPAITWHKTSPDALQDLWSCHKNWTAQNGWEKPFLFRDAFDAFVTPHLEAKKEHWDNLSQDTMIAAPQGRQNQIKEEEERSRKHKEEEEEKNKKEKAEEDARRQSEGSANSTAPAVGLAAPSRQRRGDEKRETDWGKLKETFKDAGDSAELCQKSCEATEDCLQWRYASNKGDGECHLGKVVRLGTKTTEKDDKWTSGWMIDRIEQQKQDWECKEVSWRFYQ